MNPWCVYVFLKKMNMEEKEHLGCNPGYKNDSEKKLCVHIMREERGG